MKEELILSKSESWKMFDEISLRYDLLNNLLSFGLHLSWKKNLARFVPQKPNIVLLDLATGTADVIITLIKNCRNIVSGLGIDMSSNMLQVGIKKIDDAGLNHKITLKKGDANQIPVSNESFGCATISFGIRNVEDPQVVLNEMYRVLRKEGRALILEFSMPANPALRVLHLFYLRTIVPFIGWIFSGHFKAYKYLNQTIEQFPYGDDFCRLMEKSGFKNIKANPLLFGIASIYQGDKI